MTADITIKVSSREFPAYFAYPDEKKTFSAIILIHEVWALNNHTRDVANRLVEEGYAVLAPDLLSHTGITEKIDQTILKEIADPALRDEAQKKMRAATTPIMTPEFGKETIAKLEDCFTFLLNQEKVNGKVGVMGFCFGGTYAWNLAIQQPYLNSAVAFYGHAPMDEQQLAKIACPVLAFYGEKDSALVSQLSELEEIMDRLEKDFDFVVYPNTGHAFFNNTNPVTYNKEAAEDAWAKTLAFFSKNLSA